MQPSQRGNTFFNFPNDINKHNGEVNTEKMKGGKIDTNYMWVEMGQCEID